MSVIIPICCLFCLPFGGGFQEGALVPCILLLIGFFQPGLAALVLGPQTVELPGMCHIPVSSVRAWGPDLLCFFLCF